MTISIAGALRSIPLAVLATLSSQCPISANRESESQYICNAMPFCIAPFLGKKGQFRFLVPRDPSTRGAKAQSMAPAARGAAPELRHFLVDGTGTRLGDGK